MYAYVQGVRPYMLNNNCKMLDLTKAYATYVAQNFGNNSIGLLPKIILAEEHWWIGCIAQQVIQNRNY